MRKLDDKDKIRLLKNTNIITATMLVVSNLAGKYILSQYEQLQKKDRFAARVLKRYTELAPHELNLQIFKEFEFEWITKDLDLPEFPKEK